MMGSGAEAAEEAVDALNKAGEKIGLLKVRLYRPFDASAFLKALPATVKSIAILDRCKEPGGAGEPLYQDIVTVLAENAASLPFASMPKVIGGRYGLSSKEFTPAMVKGIFDELTKPSPKNHFTDRHRRRRQPHEPGLRSGVFDRRSADGAGAVLRAGFGRHGGREQELHQDHRNGDAELRAGLLRVRLEEVGLDDDLAPALRAEADPVDLPDYAGQLCGLPQLQLPGEDRRA